MNDIFGITVDANLNCGTHAENCAETCTINK